MYSITIELKVQVQNKGEQRDFRKVNDLYKKIKPIKQHWCITHTRIELRYKPYAS